MNYNYQNKNWLGSVALSWNIFEGGQSSAGLKKSRHFLQEMLQADRKNALAIQLDVKSSYLHIDEATARKKVAEISIKQAEESLDLVKKQYQNGATTISRYLEAESMLTQSHLRYIKAKFDLKKAFANAARAIGLFSLSLNNKSTPDETVSQVNKITTS
jgi:outer membrane protein TolC